MRYIHYGSRTFDSMKWEPIRNAPFERGFTKPAGGLWASPVDAEFGWADWCQSRDQFLDGLAESFEFELSENAKVLKITSKEMVKSLPLVLDDPAVNAYYQRFSKLLLGSISFLPIDFEQISREYDVIAFNASDSWNPESVLSGWDCDCILVMNKEAICVAETE